MSANDYIGRIQTVRDSFQGGGRIRVAVLTGISQSATDAWTKQLDSWLKTKNAASDVVVYGTTTSVVADYAGFLTTALALTPKPDLVFVVAGIRDHAAQTNRTTYRNTLVNLASTCNAASVVPVFMYDNDYANSRTGTNHLLRYFEWCEDASNATTGGAFYGNYYILDDSFFRYRLAPVGCGWSNILDRTTAELAALLGGDGITPNTAGSAITFDTVTKFLGVKRIFRAPTGQSGNTLATYSEHTILMDDAGTAHLLAGAWAGSGIERWTSTNYDSANPTWTKQAGYAIPAAGHIEAQGMRASDGKFYCITRDGYSEVAASFHLWSSADCVTWSHMNGGGPVLTMGSSWTNPMRSGYSFNAAPWVDTANKRIHLVWDTVGTGTAPLAQEGLAYSSVTYTGTLDTTTPIDFAPNATTSWVIPGGGWPALQHVEGKGWLIVAGGFGSVSTENGSRVAGIAGDLWTTAYWAADGADLSLASSWNRGWPFLIRNCGVICADPSSFLAVPAGKSCKTIMGFSYSQTPQSPPDGIRLLQSDYTVAEIFDIVAGNAPAATSLVNYRSGTSWLPCTVHLRTATDWT